MKIHYGWWVDAPCWFILLITGHDNGITLVGVRVSEWLVLFRNNYQTCSFSTMTGNVKNVI
jgi:hypothetical protein